MVTAEQAQECELTFYTFGPQQDSCVYWPHGRRGGQEWHHLHWAQTDLCLRQCDRTSSLGLGLAVNLRINQEGFSCAEAGEYTCVVGTNNRTVLVTPIGECGKQCGLRTHDTYIMYVLNIVIS